MIRTITSKAKYNYFSRCKKFPVSYWRWERLMLSGMVVILSQPQCVKVVLLKWYIIDLQFKGSFYVRECMRIFRGRGKTTTHLIHWLEEKYCTSIEYEMHMSVRNQDYLYRNVHVRSIWSIGKKTILNAQTRYCAHTKRKIPPILLKIEKIIKPWLSSQSIPLLRSCNYPDSTFLTQYNFNKMISYLQGL